MTWGLKLHCSGWCGSNRNTAARRSCGRVRLVPGGLGDHPRLLRHVGGDRMIEIVRVFEGVGQHEGRTLLAVDVDEPVEKRPRRTRRG